MRVAVALSGGMDSTATALMLKRDGHEVVGLHMMLHAGSRQSWKLAQKAARELRIPIQAVDLTREFRDMIVEPFVRDYAAGRTPSPCPRCNRFIKMSMLWDKAKSMGCEALATGHYALIGRDYGQEECALLQGVDKRKDQSYFLFMLTSEVLSRTLFPLGGFTKAQVRDFLRSEGVSVSESDESQELCFIPDNNYRGFLKKKGVRAQPGPIKDLSGNVLGSHKGIVHYTVGQRRGLGVCRPRPLYVVKLDARSDTVFVGHKEETLVKRVRLIHTNILTETGVCPGASFRVKVRSTAAAVPAEVEGVESREMVVKFETPQSGVAPGQAAVIYAGKRVIGGGWIEHAW